MLLGIPEPAAIPANICCGGQPVRGPEMTTAHYSQDPPTLFTAEEAAEILRVKKSWLERQAAARKIPFTMLGRSYRFTSAHLDAIVKMHEEAPASPPWAVDRHARSPRQDPEPHATSGGSAPLRPRPRSAPRRAA
jgi:excisionase family DNA binding protein